VTVLRAAAVSDVGRVRAVNQDAVMTDATIFAVADGMGGHAGGEVASTTAISALESATASIGSSDGLLAAIQTANEMVVEVSRADPSLTGMGTTLVVASLIGTSSGDVLLIANVGDSRAYHLHGGQLEQITADHSVAAELLRAGDISEAEAASHPQRHVITRALGIEDAVEVDLFDVHLSDGDRILLCSDGLSNELEVEEMTHVLSTVSDPDAAAHDLVQRANAHGGADNISVVVIDVLLSTGSAEPMTGLLAATATATASRPSPPRPVTGSPPPPPEGREGKVARRRRLGVPRSVTFRVVLFVLLILGVIAGAWAFLRWYATSSYYVTSQGDSIVIFQGRPGGVLWFQPKLIEATPTPVSGVLPIRRGPLRRDVIEPSLAAARSYVSNLAAEYQTSITTLPTSPSTTVAGPLPTTPPGQTVTLPTTTIPAG